MLYFLFSACAMCEKQVAVLKPFLKIWQLKWQNSKDAPDPSAEDLELELELLELSTL